MRILLLAICAGLAAIGSPVAAQQAMVQNIPAPSDAGAIPLYPADNVGSARDEVWTRLGPMAVVRNVTRPTITPILPSPDKATGAAVILAPGGGMIFLAMPSEEIARTLTARGIAIDDTTVPNIGFPIVESWRRAKRPVELHAYQSGGHGFAQGGPNATHRLMLDQFTAWMAMNGFLPDPKKSASK